MQATTALYSRQSICPISVRACRAVAAGSVLIFLSSCQTAGPDNSVSQQYIPRDSTPLVVQRFTQEPQVNADTWNASMRPMFEHARTLVEQHTGQDLSKITFNVASDAVITDEVGFETHRLIHSQFDNPQFANNFLDSVMNGQRGTYAALYATRKHQVMVSQPLMQSYQRSLPADKATQDAAILALLIHELVHAADDLRYRIHENRDLNFRASFAQSAAFEGHAQWVTRNICKKANCLAGLEALDEFMFGSRNPPNKLTQPVQAVSRNVLEYSYIEGERFIDKLSKRPNGSALIANLLSNPPQDPIQILDPASYPNTEREQRNQRLIAASTSFDHPWLSSPWTSVETSPLKGVNLRTDPARRDAAVDGFTRLITSMVALQLYNESQPSFAPIELTVLRTESNDTAQLFAETLYQNTQIKNAQLTSNDGLVKVTAKAPHMEPAKLYMSAEPAENNLTYFTLVGVSGINVVQISGLGVSQNLFVDYVDKLLLNLASTN